MGLDAAPLRAEVGRLRRVGIGDESWLLGAAIERPLLAQSHRRSLVRDLRQPLLRSRSRTELEWLQWVGSRPSQAAARGQELPFTVDWGFGNWWAANGHFRVAACRLACRHFRRPEQRRVLST